MTAPRSRRRGSGRPALRAVMLQRGHIVDPYTLVATCCGVPLAVGEPRVDPNTIAPDERCRSAACRSAWPPPLRAMPTA